MILVNLKQNPKAKTLGIALLMISIPFFILTLLYCLNELKLMQITGYGVLNFELAWTQEVMNLILTSWGPLEMQQQALLTYVDFLYILCYGFFGALYVLLASRKLEGNFQEIGIGMAFTFFMAGIADALENFNLLIIINNPTSFWEYQPFLASLCASFKIGFLGAGLGFLYIASMVVISKKFSFPPVFLYIILSCGGLALIALLAIWNLFVCLLIGIIYFVMLFLIICRVKIAIN